MLMVSLLKTKCSKVRDKADARAGRGGVRLKP